MQSQSGLQILDRISELHDKLLVLCGNVSQESEVRKAAHLSTKPYSLVRHSADLNGG